MHRAQLGPRGGKGQFHLGMEGLAVKKVFLEELTLSRILTFWRRERKGMMG